MLYLTILKQRHESYEFGNLRLFTYFSMSAKIVSSTPGEMREQTQRYRGFDAFELMIAAVLVVQPILKDGLFDERQREDRPEHVRNAYSDGASLHTQHTRVHSCALGVKFCSVFRELTSPQ